MPPIFSLVSLFALLGVVNLTLLRIAKVVCNSYILEVYNMIIASPNAAVGSNSALAQNVGSVANSISNTAGLDANSASSFLNFFEQNRNFNNAWSASQARIQREWQEEQNAKAMEFNASEAAKNRDWQEMMSNTAHQREVADLQAAGLNPILSAMNGNGAAVTSGATASGVTSSGAAGQTDTSMNQMLVTLLGSFLDAQTRLQQSNISAINNLAVANKQGEINESLKRLDWNLKGDYTEKYPNNGWQFASSIANWLGDVLAPYLPDGHPITQILSGMGTAVSSARDKSYRENFKAKTGEELYGPPIYSYKP